MLFFSYCNKQLETNLIIFFIQTGTSALFFAAQGGYLEVAQILLEHGAEIDSPSIVSEIFDNINQFPTFDNNFIIFRTAVHHYS